MKKQYLLTYDLGTSSIKCTLIEAQSGIFRVCQAAYPLFTDIDGKAEQNPADWWRAFCTVSREAVQDLAADSLAALCVSGQMMSMLPMGTEGPLCPAMIWADGRAKDGYAALRAKVSPERIHTLTGIRPSENYSLPKWMEFARREPELYQRTVCFLGAKDYINYCLTGRYATDPEEAAFMLALDLRTQAWSEELLDASGIDRQKLPPVLPSGAVLGAITQAAAKACGLPCGLPVILGTGDGGAATLGAGVWEKGSAYISLGTSCWVCAAVDQAQPQPETGLNKIRYGNGYRDSGTMQCGGYVLSWLKDRLHMSFQEMGDQAMACAAGAGGVLFLPQLMGERAPFWDMKLRASFVGMTAETGTAQLCRSAVEGVGMQLRLIYQSILTANGMKEAQEIRLVGGGAESLVWRQILADIFGLPVTVNQSCRHAGALGTAAIAGKTVGMFSQYADITRFYGETLYTQPQITDVYLKLIPIFQEARAALTAIDHKLHALQQEERIS